MDNRGRYRAWKKPQELSISQNRWDIGLWNIDHPETGSGKSKDEKRYQDILEYLGSANCDAYIITEANSAMSLPGYSMELSHVSPFRSSRRFYGEPNAYHQVAIYSKLPMQTVKLDEPVNGLCCRLPDSSPVRTIYGNVVTIKDQWSQTSSKTYTDRLEEQIQAIQALPLDRTLVGGDFNLRLGWKQKQSAYRRLQEEVEASSWVWPTENPSSPSPQLPKLPDFSQPATPLSKTPTETVLATSLKKPSAVIHPTPTPPTHLSLI